MFECWGLEIGRHMRHASGGNAVDKQFVYLWFLEKKSNSLSFRPTTWLDLRGAILMTLGDETLMDALTSL